MAGSHRAPRKQDPATGSAEGRRTKAPARLTPRAVAIAVIVALVPALWLGAQRLVNGSDTPTGPQHTPSAIPPVLTSSATPTPSPTTAPPTTPTAPTATPTPRVPRLPRLAASVPRRLSVRGLLSVGFDDSISARDGGFQAASTAEAARWGSRGKPASPGTDTVFLIGKVYRDGASAFDDLPRVKVGAKVAVRTDAGVLTYTVRSSTSRPAKGLLRRPEFTARTPGRLVLVGILFDSRDDQRTGRYLIVVAQLSAVRKG